MPEGAPITFPTAVETPPVNGEFAKVVNGKTFVGWYTAEYNDASDAPDYVNTATATMSTSDVTYYAVYAEVTEEESDDPADAVKSQRLEYDTWSYSGSTTDKSSYRLFHSNSYIESDAFDLSKLIKVIVYGGTFGGSDNNSLTIGDGTNIWKSVTVSGSSQTGVNTYTDGTALSGTNKLRITCNSGTAEKTGVRISMVEIFVKRTTITASNFTTDVRAAADISFAEPEVSVKLTSGYSGQALTNPNSVAVTYSSSDASVATVNSSTGAVTELLKAGTATITASFAGNATYKPATVSYELTITEKTPNGLAYATSAIEKLTTDAAFTNTLTNNNTLTVAYTSSDTNVATVNASTGEVTIQGAGTATITATFAGDATYEAGDASYTLTVSKATPTLSFASDNAIGRVGEDFAGNALTNPANLTVSYSSSDTNVATVNASTGAVTIVAAGTTTITASFAGNDTYTSGSASYTLKVLGEPTINVADVGIAWGETFTVDNSDIKGGAITVTSGNTNIATVDGLVITPVACGEVEITVSTAENETYKSGSKTFTLTITAPEGGEDAATAITTTFTDKNLNNGGSGMNWTASISANSFESSSPARGVQFGAAIGEFTLTSSADNVTKVSMVLSTNGTGNTVGVSVGGNNFSTNYGDIDATETLTLTSGMSKETVDFIGTGSGTIIITINDKNKSVYVKSITVTPAITKTFNASGYATFCSEYPLDFRGHATADYSAWEITNISESEGVYTLTFNQLTGTIKGGQGILLKGEAGATVTIPSASSENVLSSNLLVGTLAPTYVTAGEYYGLSGQNFVRVAESTVPAGKALLPASFIDGSPVKAFNFVFEDNATGIRTVETVSPEEAAQIFDLSGRRLNKIQKGINIVNGKKVLY